MCYSGVDNVVVNVKYEKKEKEKEIVQGPQHRKSTPQDALEDPREGPY